MLYKQTFRFDLFAVCSPPPPPSHAPLPQSGGGGVSTGGRQGLFCYHYDADGFSDVLKALSLGDEIPKARWASWLREITLEATL